MEISGEEFLDEAHPLVQRFRENLQKHLVKHNDRLTFELREASRHLKDIKIERENLGTKLFQVQEVTSKHKAITSSLTKQLEELLKKHHDLEENLEASRKSLEQIQEEYYGGINDDQALIHQIGKVNRHVYNLTIAKSSLQSDIETLRQSTKKISCERIQREDDKKKQDALINRMLSDVHNNEEKIGLYEAQTACLKGEMKAVCDATSRAKLDTEVLNLEGKQLLEMWNNSLNKMKNRDETLSALQQAFLEQQGDVKISESEINAIEKSLSMNDETSSKLFFICNRLENQLTSTTSKLSKKMSEQEVLWIERTAGKFNFEGIQKSIRIRADTKSRKEIELKESMKSLQGNVLEKHTIQRELYEQVLNQHSMDNSLKAILKELHQLQDRMNQMEMSKYKTQSDILKRHWKLNERNNIIAIREKGVEDIQQEVTEKENEIAEKEIKITVNTDVINKRQHLFNKLVQKLDDHINKIGGVEMSPVEVRFNQTWHALEQKHSETDALQVDWLKQQKGLVECYEEKEKLTSDVRHSEHQLSVFTRHQFLLDEKVMACGNTCEALKRNIENLHNNLMKLNHQSYSEHLQEDSLYRSAVLIEDDMMKTLSSGEADLINLQDQAEHLHDEQEELCKELLEAENDLLILQQKLELSKEMRSVAEKEYKNGEIYTLQNNLQKMQVNFVEICKQQSQLVQGMELAVRCWDNLLTKGELKLTAGSKSGGSGSSWRIEDTQRRLHLIKKEIALWKNKIKSQIYEKDAVSSRIMNTNLALEKITSAISDVGKSLQNKSREKLKRLETIVAIQREVKLYDAVSENSYTTLCERSDSLEEELSKHSRRCEQLKDIVQNLIKDFPQFNFILDKILVQI